MLIERMQCVCMLASKAGFSYSPAFTFGCQGGVERLPLIVSEAGFCLVAIESLINSQHRIVLILLCATGK